MTITISADDPRSIKALEIAAGASQWLKVRTVDGEVAFGIPSQCARNAGRYYVVTAARCDCEDFKRNGLTRARIGETGMHGDCKHIKAVQLHDELVRAQQIRPRPRPPLPANVIRLAEQYDHIFKRFEGD
jgi:hypothetical protein